MSLGTAALLSVWTLWLVAACHALTVRPPWRPFSLGRSLVLRVGRPAALKLAWPVPLSVVFVALGLVLVLASIVTWRAYVVVALAVQAILAAFAGSAGAGGSATIRLTSRAEITRDQGARLLWSSVSLVGVVWLGLRAGGSYGQYVAEARVPALVGLALALIVYGRVLALPELRRRRDAKRDLEQRLRDLAAHADGLGDRVRALEDGNDALRETIGRQEEAHHTEVRQLRDACSAELQRLREDHQAEIARSQRKQTEEIHRLREANRHLAAFAVDVEKQRRSERREHHDTRVGGPAAMCYVAAVPGRLDREGPEDQADPNDLMRVVGISYYRERDTSLGTQQEVWVLERTVMSATPGQIANLASAVAKRSGNETGTGFGGRIADAFDEYAAKQAGDPVFEIISDRWAVRDPGGFNALAQADAGVQEGLHQLLLGAPTEAVCRAFGIDGPGSALIRGIACEVALPVDRPLRTIKQLLEVAGMAAGVLLGMPVVSTACFKAFAHDQLTRTLARGVGEVVQDVLRTDAPAQGTEAPASPASGAPPPAVSPPAPKPDDDPAEINIKHPRPFSGPSAGGM